jgi:anti-sigma B factor antagonist
MIRFEENNEMIVVSFQQDLNFETTRLMEEQLQRHQYNTKELQIDFSAVRFIDSSGVSLLIKWLYPLKEKMHISIVGASLPVKNILSICKLDKFVQVK